MKNITPNACSQVTSARKMSSFVTAASVVAFIPITKAVASVLGRGTFLWWKRQPPNAKDHYRNKAKDNVNAIWSTGTAGLMVFAATLWYHTETDPETGHRRLFMYDDSTLVELANYDTDLLLSTNGSAVLDPSDDVHSHVLTLTRKLLAANAATDRIRDQTWSLVIINKPQVNAFAMPNGFIFIYTGLLKTVNDDQLSIIIGHEMTHCARRHLNRAWSVQLAADVLHVIAIALIWATLPFYRAFVAYALSVTFKNILVLLPHARSMEDEADEAGLMIAANACVDVTEGHRYWAKMAETHGLTERLSKVACWVSTHPSFQSRAKHMCDLIPKAKKLQESADCETY